MIVSVGVLLALFSTGNASLSCAVEAFAGVQRTGTGLLYGGDGGKATSAQISAAYAAWMSTTGDDVLIGDTFNGQVRSVSLKANIITPFAGGNAVGNAGDGLSATHTSVSIKPFRMCGDTAGNIYFGMTDFQIVRKIG